jgi:hypothetical protein
MTGQKVERKVCPRHSECPVCNEQDAKYARLTDLFRRRYCVSDHESCARYGAYLLVPEAEVSRDILPTDYLKLQKLTAATKG